MRVWSVLIGLSKGAYEHRNEPSVSIKGKLFLDSVICLV